MQTKGTDAFEARGRARPAHAVAGMAVGALLLGTALIACSKAGDASSAPEGPSTASTQQGGPAASSATALPSPATPAEVVDPPAPLPATARPAAGGSIGAATMDPDGTIVLQLRAEGPAGARGDALIRYPTSHPEYQSVLKHLGGLKPGQEKPVPPWPDGGSKLSISRSGEKLGTLELRPGAPGILMLEADSDNAQALKKLWDEMSSSDSFQVNMHEAQQGRRVYGARVYKRGDSDYAEGAYFRLLSEGYEVKKLP